MRTFGIPTAPAGCPRLLGIRPGWLWPTGYRRSRSIRSGAEAVVRDPEKASSLSGRSPTLMSLAVVLAALIMLALPPKWWLSVNY